MIYRIACGKRWNSAAVLGWRGMWFRRHDDQPAEQNDPNVRLGWLADDPWTGLTQSLARSIDAIGMRLTRIRRQLSECVRVGLNQET